MKKSYYRLALIYHPDRVNGTDQSMASEKFNIIHAAYTILSDVGKRKEYDECSNVVFARATMTAQWVHYLKPVSSDGFETARNRYQGSDEEKKDIAREYVVGNGSMTYLLNTIPFMRIEDESRIIALIKELIADRCVEKLTIKKIAKK